MEILVAVLTIVCIAIVMALILAVANKYLLVKEDPRKDVVVKMMPGANCGGCGYPGCSGLVDAFIDGKVTKVSTCVVIKKDQAEKVAEYLNNTPDEKGDKLKVSA